MSKSYTANLLNTAHTKWRELKCRRATLKNDLANLDEEIDYLQTLMGMVTSQYGPMDELLPILKAASGVVQTPDEECGVEDEYDWGIFRNPVGKPNDEYVWYAGRGCWTVSNHTWACCRWSSKELAQRVIDSCPVSFKDCIPLPIPKLSAAPDVSEEPSSGRGRSDGR